MTDLKITQQILENRQALLSVEAPAQRVEEAMRAAAKDAAKRYTFPGFRPGKAPYHIIVQRLGRETLLQEAAERMGNELYSEAMIAAEIKAYGPGTLTSIDWDPLTFHFEVPLPPEADPGDYRSLRLPYTGVDEEELAQNLQKQIDAIRQEHAIWEPVDRPVAYGDLVTIAMKVRVNGEVVLENDDWDITPNAQNYTLTPIFDAAFIGMHAGEQKSFSTLFPADGDSAWAGEEGHFEVEVKSVKSWEIPPFDDDLAQEAADLPTAAALRQIIHDELRQRMQVEVDNEYQNRVFDALLAQATCNYPSVAVEYQLNVMLAEIDQRYRELGLQSLQEVLRITRQSQEEFREQLRPNAEKRLQLELVIQAIIEREQLVVSDYELQRSFQTAEFDDETLTELKERFDNNISYRAILMDTLLQQKGERLVLALAKGEEVPAPGEHVAEEAPPSDEHLNV